MSSEQELPRWPIPVAYSQEVPGSIPEVQPMDTYTSWEYDVERRSLEDDGYSPLRQETVNQVHFAETIIHAEKHRSEHIEHEISHLESRIETLEEELARIDAKINAGTFRFKKLYWRRKDVASELGNLRHELEHEGEARYEIKEHVEHEHVHDEATKELFSSSSFEALKGDIEDANKQVETRREMMARANNPQSDSMVRALLRSRINEWGPNFTLDGYRNTLLEDVTKKHEKRVEEDWQNKELELFTNTEKEVIGRIQTEQQSRTEQDDKKRDELMHAVASWSGEPIYHFRARLLHFNTRSVLRFRSWAADKAVSTFEKVQKNPGASNRQLDKQLSNERSLKNLQDKLHTFNTQPETDKLKAEKASMIREIGKIKAAQKDWKQSTDELKNEVMATAERERDLLLAAAA